MAIDPTATRTRGRRAFLTNLAVLPAAALLACGAREADGKDREATPGLASTATAASTSTSSSRATPSANADYFPPPTGDWEHTDLKAAGWSAAGIDRLVSFVKENKTATFMVVTGGRIVTENYFPGVELFADVSPGTPHDVASVQKSVASTLLGIAQDKGLLKIDDPVSKYLAPGWSNASTADEARITIRHLMTHSSGLSPRTLQKVADPGTVYDYNTDAYQKTRPLLEQATATDINTLSRRWIFDTIGVSTAAKWAPRPTADQDATGAAIWGLALTARDMARFGIVSLHRGSWIDRRIVQAAWYDEAWKPSRLKADYGLLWWLMGRRDIRNAPDDWVAALGAMDQKIYVFPGYDTVVTRQGIAAKEESENTSDFDRTLFQALAAARA
ncbi:MAG: beta-lactamase family protein [Dehalococcoidia bacterium]|nr:beta-lactamase family protein [Dehalococcoidia bacterium]